VYCVASRLGPRASPPPGECMTNAALPHCASACTRACTRGGAPCTRARCAHPARCTPAAGGGVGTRTATRDRRRLLARHQLSALARRERLARRSSRSLSGRCCGDGWLFRALGRVCVVCACLNWCSAAGGSVSDERAGCPAPASTARGLSAHCGTRGSANGSVRFDTSGGAGGWYGGVGADQRGGFGSG
jgi:hypothetical protein